MIFDAPIPFLEALRSRALRALLPTSLSSNELALLSPAVRERAMFSARTSNAEYLQKISDVVDSVLNPRSVNGVTEGMDLATARLELKQALQALDYQPSEADRDTLKDLSSDKRLDLVLRMNVQQAQGFGYREQGMDDAILDEWPAQELFRAEDRKEPRDWDVRWQSAAGEAGDVKAAAVHRTSGRMIALKDSGIWTALSAFGTPYPPFDFNSGMDVRDVDRTEAMALGLIDRDTRVRPEPRGLNEELQVSPQVRNQALLDEMLADLGPNYHFEEGVLRHRGDRSAINPPEAAF